MTSYPTPANAGHWWLTPPTWNRLHAVPADAWDLERAERESEYMRLPAVAACGQHAEWTMPGVLSRLGMPRCVWCCRTLGVPAGDGTPANQTHRDAKGEPDAR